MADAAASRLRRHRIHGNASDSFFMESTAAADLHRDTVLVRAPDLRVCIGASGSITADAAGSRLDTGPHSLAVLDCFTRPRSVAAAMQMLAARCTSPQDWADMGGTIRRLHHAGLLRGIERQGGSSSPIPSRYEGPGVHTRMLNDRTRTGLYLDALREVVRPGDVVVDLGTGSGVLAVAAAKLGARRVYAIEASAIASVAERVAQVNGVADVVTILRGQSTQLTLPEPATVVVSELIGNDPLGERVLELLRDARSRFCHPDVRFIPSDLELFLLPVAIDAAHVARHLPTADRVDTWQRWYGIDLSPLAYAVADGWEMTFHRPIDAAAFEPLGPSVSLGRLRLGDAHSFPIVRDASLSIARPGHLGGIVMYFEAQLSPGVRLSLDPRQRPRSHWTLPVWLGLSSIAAQAGDMVDCQYRYAGASHLSIPRFPRGR
jgi:Ribosomal protein L11 methyltransferase (PrmA)